MKLSLFASVVSLASFLSLASARVLTASSLVSCQGNSTVSATTFDVVFSADNLSISYDVTANVEISGDVTADLTVYAYGFPVITKTLNPCTMNLPQLCPLTPGQISIQSNSQLSQSVVDDIPGIAYSVPDIDLEVFLHVHDSDGNQVACIQAQLSNQKTVNHVGVKWATAIIAGIGLVTSALLSIWGNSYTAAYIATNSVSLFTYFQSVVIVAMEAVDRVPPIASSWAQNLAWSMGLIEVKFMQKIFNWYVQATGGTATNDLTFHTIQILVQRSATTILHPRVRDLWVSHGEPIAGYAMDLTSHLQELLATPVNAMGLKRSAPLGELIARNDESDFVAQSTPILLVLRGIKRMAFEAGIEQTSVVLTSFTFFVFICVVIALVFGFARLVVGVFFKGRFDYFRHSWLSMLKGALLRLVFIGFPQLLILSMWEFIERDSAAVIILAVFFLILSIGILGWNSFKVFIIGQKSIAEHNTPVYLLYSDSQVINKYGFLYTQFEGSHYYFIAPVLAYMFVKSCIIAFAQSSGKAQGIAIFLVELAYLILVAWKKPYMDKTTNVINIIIGVVVTLNALFFLFFSNLFGQPTAVSSVMGMVFFIMNAAFSLVLLIFTLVTCAMVLFSKNPDSRFAPAKDDRSSFIQQQGKPDYDVTHEFTALGDASRADHDDAVLIHSPMPDSDSMTASNPFSEKRQSGYESGMESEMSGSREPTRSWPSPFA